MSTTLEVGDVAAWDATPSWALVRDDRGEFAVKTHDWAFWVGLRSQGACGRKAQWYPATQGRWNPAQVRGRVTIIALNVPADATADGLRELAEVFEVREVLRWEAGSHPSFWRVFLGQAMIGGFSGSIGSGLDHWASRLHAAGWRPGMTAEDAARLLAEAGA